MRFSRMLACREMALALLTGSAMDHTTASVAAMATLFAILAVSKCSRAPGLPGLSFHPAPAQQAADQTARAK